MAKYELKVRPSVAKDIEDVPKGDVKKILARIEALRDDPRPPGSQKLSGSNSYRIRQGNYRILYDIEDSLLIICVVKVGHRRDVYR